MSLTPIAFAFALLLVGGAAALAAPVKRASAGHAAAAHPGESSGIGPDFGSYLTFEIASGATECVFEEVKVGDTLEMWFEIVRGDDLSIHFKLGGPGDVLVHERTASFAEKNDVKTESEGHVVHNVKSNGLHSICFLNTHSSSHKTISLFLRDIADSPSHLPSIGHEIASIAKVEHLGPMWDATLQLDAELNSVELAQHHMRVREQVHRDTAENTNTRVAIFTVLESALLITIATLQLLFVRAWFSDNGNEIRRPGRV